MKKILDHRNCIEECLCCISVYILFNRPKLYTTTNCDQSFAFVFLKIFILYKQQVCVKRDLIFLHWISCLIALVTKPIYWVNKNQNNRASSRTNNHTLLKTIFLKAFIKTVSMSVEPFYSKLGIFRSSLSLI